MIFGVLGGFRIQNLISKLHSLKLDVHKWERDRNKRNLVDMNRIEEKQPNFFNRDDGLILSESWKPILNLLKKQQEEVGQH